MNKISKLFAYLLWLIPFSTFAQKTDTLIKKLDSLNKQPTELKRTPSDSIQQEKYNDTTKITFRNYFILLGSDLKQQLTAPFHIKAHDWGKVAKFALLTGAVILADEPVNRVAVDIRNKSKTVTSVSRFVTRFGGSYEAYSLAALASYGFIFKNEKIKTTTLLATQAYITSAVIFEISKFLTGRQRPIYYDPDTHENDPSWHGPFFQFKKDKTGNKPAYSRYSSFPSGHTTLAFAACTVFAMEYSDRPLVPILSYSAATLIGLTRIIENKHWATDVLVGAALGYLSGRQVVNNYHRYARLKSEEAKKKNKISFNLEYFQGRILPGIIYTFR